MVWVFEKKKSLHDSREHEITIYVHNVCVCDYAPFEEGRTAS